MRIAYLTSQYPATSHTFISREIAAVRALGVEIDTFSIRPPSASQLQDGKLAAESRETFTVLRQPWTRFLSAHLGAMFTRPGDYFRTLALAARHRAPGFKGFGVALAHFAEAIVLADELRQRRVTRLHNHFANSAATVGLLAKTFLKLPWSFTIHGISEFDYPAGLLLGRKIEAAEFVACVSWFGRAQAMRLVDPAHWPKLHVVRCGLVLGELPEHSKADKVKRIISVGRLSPEKGQAGLLQAFASLSRGNDALELLIVGDGPDRASLEAQATRLGLADKVTFAGRCGEHETLDHIARSDILVLSSFMEGLPIVLMEAMAIGTAVVASRVAGIPELVEDGRTGLLFTPSDWAELAASLGRLVDDEGLRVKLAAAAKKSVRADYDVERSASAMRDLFAGAKS
jgi:glycosyltransferase involved in cell wall biosynthesis